MALTAELKASATLVWRIAKASIPDPSALGLPNDAPSLNRVLPADNQSQRFGV
jgi:hypothetical protein